MSTDKIRVTTILVAGIVAYGLAYTVDNYIGTDLLSYVFLLFLVLQNVLELIVNKVRVGKLDECIEKVKWSDRSTRHPVIHYVSLFILGVITYFILPKRIEIMLLALCLVLIVVVKYNRHKKTMEIYEEGIYVNGYFARFEEMEVDKGEEYLNIRIPYSIFGKYYVRVTGKEEIEKIERVVDIEGV